MSETALTFDQRVTRLKEYLPKRYSSIVMYNSPETKHSTIYNLLHRGTKNEGVLSLMENLFIKN